MQARLKYIAIEQLVHYAGKKVIMRWHFHFNPADGGVAAALI